MCCVVVVVCRLLCAVMSVDVYCTLCAVCSLCCMLRVVCCVMFVVLCVVCCVLVDCWLRCVD